MTSNGNANTDTEAPAGTALDSRSRWVGLRASLARSRDVFLVLLGSGLSLLGSYLAQTTQMRLQERQVAAVQREQVQRAAMSVFEEIARATNDVMYREQMVLNAAAGDVTAPPLDSAIAAMNGAAASWRRELPRRRALARTYFCWTGEMSLMQADRMLDHYYDAMTSVDAAVAKQKISEGKSGGITIAERTAWMREAKAMSATFASINSSWAQQVEIVTRFQVWMASAVRDARAGRPPGGCELEE